MIVEERLAACVNTGMRSIYRWNGNRDRNRSRLSANSRAPLFERLEHCTLTCIVTWPIEIGHQPYLDWITQRDGLRKSA